MEPRDIGNYIVYPDGRIWSKWKKSFMKLAVSKKQYIIGILDYKNVIIHRLIADLFLPNPLNLPEVDHINGNKQDNRVENLEWVSSGENQKRAYNTGLRTKMLGETNPASVITSQQAYEIKYVHTKIGKRPLAKMYKCSAGVISSIRQGKTWKHI